MKRTLILKLEIEVEDMSPEELADAGYGEFEYDDESEDEADGSFVEGLDPYEIAELVPHAIKHPDSEIFAGSGIFANLGEVRVKSADWAKPLEASTLQSKGG